MKPTPREIDNHLVRLQKKSILKESPNPDQENLSRLASSFRSLEDALNLMTPSTKRVLSRKLSAQKHLREIKTYLGRLERQLASLLNEKED